MSERMPKTKRLKRSRSVEPTRKMATPPPTERKEPLFVPTYKFAFEPISACPPSPVSVVFEEDDKTFGMDEKPMSLDDILRKMEVPKETPYVTMLARGPDTDPISEITESVLDDVSSELETPNFDDSLFDLLDVSF
jgi:hypothetical protein